MSPNDLTEALAMVKEAGYVAVKEKSYRASQERQRRADARADYAERQQAIADQWARNCLEEERRTRERLTFIWGVACQHGAKAADLTGADPFTRESIAR